MLLPLLSHLRSTWGMLLVLALLICLTLPTIARTTHQGTAASVPGASVSTKVAVPSTMRAAPFDTDRYLNVPPDFSIAVYARIPEARFMALAPNGDLLVSQPGSGQVTIMRPKANGSPTISTFVSGLRRPHDIVFHTIGAVTYVYISETNQINRFVYNADDLTAHDRQIVVKGLPDASSPELGGAYGHELKNIALDSNHKLYVSLGSTCNVCESDTTSNPVRAAIYQYDADGSNGRLFARGLRNAEGLAFVPGTNDLWAVVNNRDQIPNPTTGQVDPTYVDNHPPEEFTRVQDGGNTGWPYCNPNPDTASGYDNMPFDRDHDFNADGHVDCSTMNRVNKGIQAHSAPLGLTFLGDTAAPGVYRNGALVALHGSWNRTTRTGYKVAYFPWDSASQAPGAQVDLVTGWVNTDQSVWGRPVDTAVDPQGNIFISDDASGTIYKLTYNGPAQINPTSIIPPNATTHPVYLPIVK